MRIALEPKHCQPTWLVYSRRCRGTRGEPAGAGVGSGRGDFPWAVLRHRIFPFTECYLLFCRESGNSFQFVFLI